MFDMPNETAKEESIRLAHTPRTRLTADLEATLARVKDKPQELPISVLIQCRPLSANMMSGRRKSYETKQYLAYRDLIAKVVGGFYGIKKTDKFHLHLEGGFSNKRSDLDNIYKGCQDAITACIDDIFDDSQIVSLSGRKVQVPKGMEYLRIHMKITQEVWEVVEENPEYRISNLGRVLHGPSGSYVESFDRSSAGYKSVRLYVEDKLKVFAVHRLVASAFVKKPKGCAIVNHLDEDPSNNCAENLQWTTTQGNIEYSTAKLYEVVSPEGELILIYNMKKFCREHELNAGNMNNLVRGRVHSCEGYTLAATFERTQLTGKAEENPRLYNFISPEGELFTFHHLLNFCKAHGLQASNMVKVYSDERKTHKGWTKA